MITVPNTNVAIVNISTDGNRIRKTCKNRLPSQIFAIHIMPLNDPDNIVSIYRDVEGNLNEAIDTYGFDRNEYESNKQKDIGFQLSQEFAKYDAIIVQSRKTWIDPLFEYHSIPLDVIAIDFRGLVSSGHLIKDKLSWKLLASTLRRSNIFIPFIPSSVILRDEYVLNKHLPKWKRILVSMSNVYSTKTRKDGS